MFICLTVPTMAPSLLALMLTITTTTLVLVSIAVTVIFLPLFTVDTVKDARGRSWQSLA